MAIWSYYRGAESLDIKVGYRCNNECIHRVVDPVRHKIAKERGQEDLSTTDVEALIDSAVWSDVHEVVLTGGEVSIRKDFEHLVRYAAGRGLRTLIQSNGRIFSQRKLCERIADIDPVFFVIALHASVAEIHDAITHRRGSFHQTCAGIRNLRDIGKEVAAKIVLTRANLGEMVATADLAKGLNVNEFCVVFPHALDFPRARFLDVVPTYNDVREEILTLAEYVDSISLPTTYESIPYCVADDCLSLWKGSCDLRSSIRSRRVLDVNEATQFDWESLRPAMKCKPITCAECVFDKFCEGPWREYVDAFGFGEFQPVGRDKVAGFLVNAEVVAGQGEGGEFYPPNPTTGA